MKITAIKPCIAAVALAATASAADDCHPAWDHFFGTPGIDGWVYAMKAIEHDGASHLYVAGTFTHAGGVPANSIARWDGAQWSSFGQGFDRRVLAIAMFDSGNGPELYVGGAWSEPEDISYIARWNPDAGQWESVGGGIDAAVIALTVFDDGTGPALYAGGTFQHAGGQPAPRLARWDGTSWSSVGSGADDSVRAMIVLEEPSGPVLYVGGNFSVINGLSAARIARWDGTVWSRLGSGLSGLGIRTMDVFDDGTGPQLYVGGVLTTAGGLPVANLARWDLQAKAWAGMGGVNERVVNVRSFDDGTGPKLFIGGWFTEADGQPIARLGTFDGTAWGELGSGADSVVRSFEPYDDGTGLALYTGGGFTQMDGQPASGISRWKACPVDPIPGDLNGDGVVDVSDLLILLAAWGPCPRSGDCPADLNGDGVVDVSDLLLLLENWG